MRDSTNEEKQAVGRLIPYARRKTFVTELLVNGYNSQIAKTDVAALMRYDMGEPAESTYVDDIYTFLRVIARGIETHEIIGQETMDDLLKIVPRHHCNDCRRKFADEDLTQDADGFFRCPSCGTAFE